MSGARASQTNRSSAALRSILRKGASARYVSICRARASFCFNLSSSVALAVSIASSVVSSTLSGAPIAKATMLNGFGTCVQSQLFAVQ